MDWYPEFAQKKNLYSSYSDKDRNDSMQKWGKNLNRHFSKDMQMADKHMKRCPVSLAIRET